jgi:hypothetical protein
MVGLFIDESGPVKDSAVHAFKAGRGDGCLDFCAT